MDKFSNLCYIKYSLGTVTERISKHQLGNFRNNKPLRCMLDKKVDYNFKKFGKFGIHSKGIKSVRLETINRIIYSQILTLL